jgi:hypothetical protein
LIVKIIGIKAKPAEECSSGSVGSSQAKSLCLPRHKRNQHNSDDDNLLQFTR